MERLRLVPAAAVPAVDAAAVLINDQVVFVSANSGLYLAPDSPDVIVGWRDAILFLLNEALLYRARALLALPMTSDRRPRRRCEAAELLRRPLRFRARTVTVPGIVGNAPSSPTIAAR